MNWLHRLQQRLSLTKNEAMALTVLSAFLIIGILARHIQQRVVPVPVGAYDELDRIFFERSARFDSTTASTSVAVDRRIDINRADADELEALPRIGPATAGRILEFRAAYGPFHAIDDLEQIRGIGPKTVDLLRPHVVVSRDPHAVDSLALPVDARR